MALTRYWFNTGVRIGDYNLLMKGDAFIDGIRHIPFYCKSIPNGFKLAFFVQQPKRRQFRPIEKKGLRR